MAAIKPLQVLLFWVLVFSKGIFDCNGSVLFYEKPDFKGKVYQEVLSEFCRNYPLRPFQGSIKTNECIAVFDRVNCQRESSGFVIKSDYRNVTNLSNTDYYYEQPGDSAFGVYSYRRCEGLEYRTEVNLVYIMRSPTRNIILKKEYSDECGCFNIPKYYDGATSSDIIGYGTCFNYYKTNHCDGNPIIHGTKIYTANSDKTIRSAEACELPIHCRRVKAIIFNFEKVPDLSKPEGIAKNITMSAKHTYVNDGIATISDIYEVESEVTETAEFEFSKSILDLVSFGTIFQLEGGVSASANLKAAVPYAEELGLKIGVAVESSIKLTGTWKDNRTISESYKIARRISKTNRRKFVVSDILIVQPCTEYTASTQIRMADNVEIIYRMQFEITAETPRGTKLRSEKIIESLELQEETVILADHPRANDFAVVAETTAKFKSRHGVFAHAVGRGDEIKSCIERHNRCSCKY